MVLAKPRRWTRTRKGPGLAAVRLGVEEGRRHREELATHAAAGDRLLVGTSADLRECRRFFVERGYEPGGEVAAVDVAEHPMLVAWHRDGLANALALAVRRGSNALCGFGHDADPIYVFGRSA